MQMAFCQSFFSPLLVRLMVLLVALVATGCDQDTAENGDKPDQPNQLVDQSTEQEAPASNQQAATDEPGDHANAEQSSDDSDQTTSDQTKNGDDNDSQKGQNDKHDHSNRPKNHLANESSLYLRMHVRNPVDWYPWGPAAFKKAKEEGKLIFLSVGYSSCYWCHVMERESFDDEEIAKFLNDNFVCIKVDREERPDVDSIYMTAVQIRMGRGGWPMSVFMTPDAKPFFGGTYFPARDGDRGPRSTGFLTIVNTIDKIWNTQRENVLKDADTITGMVQKQLRQSALPAEPNQELLDSVTQSLEESFDETYGGFGFDPADPRRPKFPEPSNLLYLLDLAKRTDNDRAKQMLVTSLERMHMGGIWDHVGGGFHRYSVDRFWKIPHFEKMLYDNGQLLSVYAGAYELTKREDFRRVIERTVSYMNRELQADKGGYFAAMDAESEKVEGKFYRWELPEVKKLLGVDYDLFAKVFQLDAEPNFEHEFYVPQLNVTFAEAAKANGMTEAELEKKLQPMRDKLLTARNQRPRPLTDNKIITSWNGLAIRGLADAGRILNDPEITKSGVRAANFILDNLRTTEGRLRRTYTEGKASLNGYLDDYAFLIDGLLALHQATDDDKWLITATELMETQIELFWDEENGGFFFTSKDHESLIARAKSFVDSVRPAGNSVSIQNLLYLANASDRDKYRTKAEKTMQVTAGLVQQSPGIATRATTTFHTVVEK